MTDQGSGSGPLRCPCDGAHLSTVFRYDAPPEGEVRFDLGGSDYRREVQRCGLCRHFVSINESDISELYSGDYVDATYGSQGLRDTFERIVALPPEKSDNAGRVRRIVDFGSLHFDGSPPDRARTVLDIGSGLGVFPYAMRGAGWSCTALDPDARAVEHCREVAEVHAVQGDFLEMDVSVLGRYDAVTFNKVLEHVPDPIVMLERSRGLLEPDGFVYVELPDGDAAAVEGPEREEFFIEHHHVFSPASVALLASRAGFSALAIERLREPSTKFTIRAFLVPADRG